MLAFSLLAHRLEEALGWMVLHSLWQGSLIAFLLGLLFIAMRNRTAEYRYRVANLALALVLICAVGTFLYYYNGRPWFEGKNLVSEARLEGMIELSEDRYELLSQESAIEALEQAKLDLEQAALAQEHAELAIEQAEIQAELADLQAEHQALQADWQAQFGNHDYHEPLPAEWNGAFLPAIPVPASMTQMGAYFQTHLPLIVTLWLFGVVFFLLRLLSGVSYIHYLKRRMNFHADEYWMEMLEKIAAKINLGKTVELMESALVRTPQVFGYFKPVILFPLGMINRLPPEEVEAVLAHELSHILRHDPLFLVLQNLVEALFYYHPGVWWISQQIHNERESACDELAISITGDAMNYAKALVTVQEMGFLPQSAALAFAGDRPSQFVQRMHRILKVKSPTTGIMEKIFSAVLILSTLVGMGWTHTYNSAPIPGFEGGFNVSVNEPPAAIANADLVDIADFPNNGFWNARIDGEKVELELRIRHENGQWNMGEKFDKNEFSALPATESEFSVNREAGILKLKGKFEDKEGYGRFTFEPSSDFRTYLESQGISGNREEDFLHLFMVNVNKTYIGYLKSKGFENLNRGKLVEMAIHGLDKQTLEGYFAAFDKYGYAKPGTQRLIELKIHGASPAYLDMLNSQGFTKIGLDEVVQAKIHGISGDYLKGLGEAGYKNLDIEQAVQFKIHGVTGDYAKRMTAANGGKLLSADELVQSKIHGLQPERISEMQRNTKEPLSVREMQEYQIHGVDDAYLKELKDSGFGNLDHREVTEAKIHGISGDYLKGLKEAGFADLSLRQAVEAKIHGLSIEQVKAFKTQFKDLNLRNAIEFRIHGINADYLRRVNEAGLKDISNQRLVEMKIHGVQPEQFSAYKQMGFADIRVSELIQLKIHGVNPDFIKEYQQMGFKNLELDEVVNLKIHGVTPDYIKRMQDKGFKNLSLDDYLKMKIHGIANER
jgi:beta-lactamase regulating signal transducer with metallopeptidase domain